MRIWTTGSSAGKAPRRATADTRLLPLCADGCARRFFRLRAAVQPGSKVQVGAQAKTVRELLTVDGVKIIFEDDSNQYLAILTKNI